MPGTNKIWERLCTLEALQRGWHLTRAEMYQDFVKEPLLKEAVGYFSEEILNELLRILKTEQYSPTPLRRVAIPKGSLGTRPGTVLALEDRIILFGALQLFARKLDEKLSDSVYSFRVKKKDAKNSLFYEGDAISLPFLKNKTVKKYIDPFDPWYGLWPKFDEESKKAFVQEGFLFMATSDIAAYFENIQIDILREQLNDLMPGEQKIINLFMTSFAAWTYDTEQGRRFLRGIPQGSQISSFFGNLFLKPIDEAFERFGENNQIKYFRYMDDIRIFTKEYNIAREAILLLDTQIRHLHLNLQTAKTKIYDENDGEISSKFIDSRLDQVHDIQEEINQRKRDAKKSGNKIDFSDLINKCEQILDQEPDENSEEQKIKHSRKPLKGLTDRVFRRLFSCYLAMDNDQLISLLLREIKMNDDPRLGLKLIQYGKRFPRKKQIQSELLHLILSPAAIFPYQEAQILEALRYQSRTTKELLDYCKDTALNKEKDILVRSQALRIISKSTINRDIIELAQKCFEESQNISLKKAAALTLMRQRGLNNEEFVNTLEFHPNDVLRKLGRLVRATKDDKVKSDYFLKHAFDDNSSMVDHISLFYIMAESVNPLIINNLLRRIKSSKAHRVDVNMDIRDRLKEIINYSEQNLRNMSYIREMG